MAERELVRSDLVSPYLEPSDCRLPIDRERPSVITTNFSDTEIKIAECQFFLNLVEQNASHQAVMYFGLSAFLAAARSVTLYLQAEGCKSVEFEEWYAGVRERLKDDEVARFLKVLRDEALHARYTLIKTVFDIPLYKTEGGWVHDATASIYRVLVPSVSIRERIEKVSCLRASSSNRSGGGARAWISTHGEPTKRDHRVPGSGEVTHVCPGRSRTNGCSGRRSAAPLSRIVKPLGMN